MNLDVISRILAGRAAIAQWQVTETRTVRHERYLTFLKPEAERETAATRWSVWLALPAADGRQGEASFTLTPTDGGGELKDHLDAAIAAAAAAPNPAWELPAPGQPGVAGRGPGGVHIQANDQGAAAAAQMAAATDGLVDQDVARRAPTALADLQAAFATAVAAAPWTRPSALELFASVIDRRLVNHQGLDLSERRTRLYAEFVLLHRPEGGEEIEFYDKAEAAAVRDLRLGERTAEAAACLRAGAAATAPPTGRLPVLIGGDYLAGMLGWFAGHADAALHARKIAALALDRPVCAGGGGDPLHLATDPRVPSLAAYRFDEHGYAACRTDLVRDGILADLHGSGRWMQVLGRPPRGQLGTLVAPAGTAGLDELRQGALEILQFSEFRPRHDTGAFSGEIRFAWWHRPDGSRVAVKGGSVSGLLHEAMAGARFSRETTTTGGWHGPRAIRLTATVAG